MAVLRQISFRILAGQSEEVAALGDYIRVKASGGGLVRITTNEQDVFELEEGEDASLQKFSRLRVENLTGTDILVKLMIGLGAKSGSAKLSGSVAVSNSNGTFNQSVFSHPGGVNAVILNSNPARRYLLIRNESMVASLYLNFSGAATVQDLELQPGQTYELDSFCCTNAVNARISASAQILIIEGVGV